MRLVSLAPAFLALLIASPALADAKMTLSGTGIVRSAPDMATITTGVLTQSQTAREALDANTAAMAELIEVLRAAGLENRDIQTSDFNVNPQYVYTDRRDEHGYTLPPQISGYQVTNSVTITVRDLDSLGAVLDQAVTVGANTINGISFSVADPAKLYEEARRRAVADAFDKARVYAEALDVRLGSIEAISEQDHYTPPQPVMRAAVMEFDAGSAVPVEAGELTHTITATITWSIED